MMMHRIRFVEHELSVPVVRFFLDDGTEAYAIVDSGSEQTVFDTDLVRRHPDSFVKSDTFDISMTGIQSTDNVNTDMLETVMSFTVSVEYPITIRAFGISAELGSINEVLRNRTVDTPTISAILGSDFLDRYSFKLDFKTKEMTFNYDFFRK